MSSANNKVEYSHFEHSIPPKQLEFNQLVYIGSCVPIIFGKVVQIRHGIGAFGSDLVFIREKDGNLKTVENVSFHPVKKEYEGHYLSDFPNYEDSTDKPYTIGYTSDGEKYPETGFYIENPINPYPNRIDTFSLIIKS